MLLAYWPDEVIRHPWHRSGIDVHELPFFGLTNKDEAVFTDEHYRDRDTVVGFGSDEASVRLARLLLDMSRPSSKVNEVELEGDSGFRGVAPMSAEAMLRMPGSFAWGFGWKLPKA